jgi:hypothetical protein
MFGLHSKCEQNVSAGYGVGEVAQCPQPIQKGWDTHHPGVCKHIQKENFTPKGISTIALTKVGEAAEIYLCKKLPTLLPLLHILQQCLVLDSEGYQYNFWS